MTWKQKKLDFRLLKLELDVAPRAAAKSTDFEMCKNMRLVPPLNEEEVNQYFICFEQVASALKWLVPETRKSNLLTHSHSVVGSLCFGAWFLLFCCACRGALRGWAGFAVSGVADTHALAAGWQSAHADKPCSPRYLLARWFRQSGVVDGSGKIDSWIITSVFVFLESRWNIALLGLQRSPACSSASDSTSTSAPLEQTTLPCSHCILCLHRSTPAPS